MAALRATDPDELLFFVRDEETGESAPRDIEATVEALPDADGATLRRVRLRNASGRPRRLTLTSYAGIVLHDAAAHAAHPAFSKLFVQTEREGELLLAHRRPRSAGERTAWMVHALAAAGPLEWETDRARFLGRGRTPARAARAGGEGAALGDRGQRARSGLRAQAPRSASGPARPPR